MKSELDKLCTDLGIQCHSMESEAPATGEWAPGSRHFHVTLTRKVGRQVHRFTISFSQGSAHTKPPTPADVLSCLVGDCHAGEQSFEEFCADMGLERSTFAGWLKELRKAAREARDEVDPQTLAATVRP